MLPRILVVEDDPTSQAMLQKTLERDYRVMVCGTVEKAVEELLKGEFDLVLLDIMLPDGDGMRLLAFQQTQPKLREVPVLVLTGKTQVQDKVTAFSLGADDYITKPFDVVELKARVDSKIKKTFDQKKRDSVLLKGDLRLHVYEQRAYWIREGKETPIDLTPFEFKLLLHFLKHEDHVLSREQLLTRVWGEDVYVTHRTVDTHVSNLRKKITGSQYGIETVHGMGYKFSREAVDRTRKKKAA